jgi:hypothetical protein
MPKENPNTLTGSVEASVQARIKADKKRFDDELKAVQKRFGKAMKELPKAVEAAGGPKAKELEAIGRQLSGGSSASAYKKIYRDFSEAHGPAIEKAFESVGLDAESFRKEFLKISGIEPEHWTPDRYLTGSTGLLLAEGKGEK